MGATREFLEYLEYFDISEEEFLKQQDELRHETLLKKGEGFKKFRKCNNSKRPKPRKKKR